jgi:hypothetical protein
MIPAARTSLCLLALLCAALHASPARAGDRLGFTGAVSEVEGAAGGGLVPWALIGGLGTDTETGASAFVTGVSTADFSLRAGGAAIGWDDRLEVSVARQRFEAASVAPGLTLGQDIAGAKLRLAGDAIFAPDEWLPQLAVGAQWKRTLDFEGVPRAVGAASGEDIDWYLAATKLYFGAAAGRNVIIDATLRRTRANQFGLLGFGAAGARYRLEPELSAAVFVTDTLLAGGEYRRKPDNLAAFSEDRAGDLFLAWGPGRNLSVTVAWADLGRIAGKAAQRGLYASLWLGI